jgi:two-component system OmpR family sensor kinase
VLDEGRGLPPAFLAHAFERFSRADPGRTGHGAGLGLAIVELIASAHHGQAGLANRPDRPGADAWIRLPTT